MSEKLKVALSKIDAALDLLNNSGLAGRIIDMIADRVTDARRALREAMAETDDSVRREIAAQEYTRLETEDGMVIYCPPDKVAALKASYSGARWRK